MGGGEAGWVGGGGGEARGLEIEKARRRVEVRTSVARGERVSLTSLEGVSLTSLPSCSANGMVCASDIWFSSEDVGESWARAAQSNAVGIEPGVGSGRSAASSDRGCVHGAWCGSSEGPCP